MRSVAAVLSLSVVLLGCETLEAVDRTLHDVVPLHPVTGRPVPSLIPEAQEIQTADERHQRLLAEGFRKGLAIDAPGPRLDQTEQVFPRLVAVAHRQQLPWSVELLGDPVPNAFTIGGGRVYVNDGLFGSAGLVRDGDDDELAAVLAHEIAHVALLHVSLQETWQLLVDRAREDPFYRAAFTTEQEAEADRLSVLYMALAGFDPRAGERIWRRAHERSGSDPLRGGFLHDHPLPADRIAIVHSAAEQVMP